MCYIFNNCYLNGEDYSLEITLEAHDMDFHFLLVHLKFYLNEMNCDDC